MESQMNQMPAEEVIYKDRSNFYRGILALTKKLFMF